MLHALKGRSRCFTGVDVGLMAANPPRGRRGGQLKNRRLLAPSWLTFGQFSTANRATCRRGAAATGLSPISSHLTWCKVGSRSCAPRG